MLPFSRHVACRIGSQCGRQHVLRATATNVSQVTKVATFSLHCKCHVAHSNGTQTQEGGRGQKRIIHPTTGGGGEERREEEEQRHMLLVGEELPTGGMGHGVGRGRCVFPGRCCHKMHKVCSLEKHAAMCMNAGGVQGVG